MLKPVVQQMETYALVIAVLGFAAAPALWHSTRFDDLLTPCLTDMMKSRRLKKLSVRSRTTPVMLYRSTLKRKRDHKSKMPDDECDRQSRNYVIQPEEALLYNAHKELQREALERKCELFLTVNGLEWVPYRNQKLAREYAEQGYSVYSPCLSGDEVHNEVTSSTRRYNVCMY